MIRHIRCGWAPHRTWCKVEPSGHDITEGQDDEKPTAEACRACRQARTDDARAMLGEIHKATSADPPREDCPFSLTPPKAPKFTPNGWQDSLF